MSAPRWTHALLRWIAPPRMADDVIGDLDEAHGRRVARRGRWLAAFLTSLEALDMARALRREARRAKGESGRRPRRGPVLPFSILDFKLGLRMLVRYPGLTVVGGLAMAFGIGIGAITFEAVKQILVTSFAVSRRIREIGLRLALGAEARGIVLAIFRRPITQVGAGGVIGGLLAFLLSGVLTDGLTPGEVGTMVGYAVGMLLVCSLACIVPTRRALSIEPTDALRVDG